MKKIFTIIAASISGLVALFLITTCFIKTNVSIASNNPVYVLVFNQSTTATKENGYTAFTTTLLISPYQKHEELIKICQEMAEKYQIEFFLRGKRKTN